MVIKILVLIAGIIFLIDLVSLTAMWIMNINALKSIKRYLPNEKEEEIEVL
jgi:hypothetical protein